MRAAPSLVAALCLAASACAGPSAGGGDSSRVSTTTSTSSESSTPSSTASSGTGRVTSATSASAPDCAKVRCVALTFDDGPDPANTPALLDTLERENVTATMFLVGKHVTAHPGIVRRQQALGLEIANHTQTHATLSELSSAGVTRELSQAQQAIQAVTGTRPTLMRPPYAARSSATDAVARREGLAVVVWDWSPQDWVNHDAATVVDKTLEGTRPGSILLFHDIHPWTVAAVPKIIDKLRAQGYYFVTVSQLIGSPQPGRLYPD